MSESQNHRSGGASSTASTLSPSSDRPLLPTLGDPILLFDDSANMTTNIRSRPSVTSVATLLSRVDQVLFGDAQASRPLTGARVAARRGSFTHSAMETALTGFEDPHPAGRYSPGPALPPPPPYSPRRSRSREQPQGRRSAQRTHAREYSRRSSAHSSSNSGRSAPQEEHFPPHPHGHALTSIPTTPLRNPRRSTRPGRSPSRSSEQSSERSSNLSLSDLDSNSAWSGVESLSGESDFSTSSKYSGDSVRHAKAFEGGRIEYIRRRSMHRPCQQDETNQGSKTLKITRNLEDEYRRMKLVKTQKTHFSGPTKHVRQNLRLVGSTRGIFDSRAAGRPDNRGRQEQTKQERSFHR